MSVEIANSNTLKLNNKFKFFDYNQFEKTPQWQASSNRSQLTDFNKSTGWFLSTWITSAQLFQPEIKTTRKNNNNSKSSEAYSEPSQRSKIEPFWQRWNQQRILTIYVKSTLLEVRQSSEYASETFYQFLDLRYSILKQLLQIINIVLKTWSFIFKNNFESTINVSEYVVNIVIPTD